MKTLPSLSKFGVWLGVTALVSHVSNNPELSTSLSAIGVVNLDGACEVIKNLASGKLSDYYKEFRQKAGYGINHDIQLAMREGIANALTELEKTFYHAYTVSAKEREQIELFFRSLSFQLGDAIESESQINSYALDRADFFIKLLNEVNPSSIDEDTNTPKKSVFEPELSDATAESLVVFLTEQLESIAYRYINEEFKSNGKAQTGYFIHLLEYSARTNQENNVIVSSILNDIRSHQQADTEILRQIAKAQQRIFDSIRKSHLDFKAYSSEFKEFKERLDTQLEPSLRLPNYHNLNESFTYQYGLRYTNFISREAEMEQLWDFLNGQPKRQMLWWIVTGPGGMGKNRLALEFCLEARCVNRYVGFVETDHLLAFDWSQWRPSLPTLLVIDYVAAYAEPTRMMIEKLSKSAQGRFISQPIRVLLLERKTSEDWWYPFLNDRDVAECSYISGQPDQVLDLKSFTDTERWQIVVDIHRKQKKILTAKQEETLHALADIDPEGRPLFAFLAAMALAEGEDIRNWNVHDLLNNLLQREENKIWKTHPKWSNERCREGHKNLLVLTTLTRGLTVSQLKKIFQENPSWLPASRPDTSLYERISDIRERTTPTGQTEKVYIGMLPDVVGEYYCLSRIHQLLTDEFTGEETVQALLRTAWDMVPEETWSSVGRALSDFSYFPDKNALQYVEISRPSTNAPETAWKHWAYLRFYLIVYYGSVQQWSKAESCYNDLQALTKTYSHNEEIILQQADGAVNLTSYYGRQGHMSKAEARYIDLKVLANIYPHNVAFLNKKAMGLSNLIAAYGLYGNLLQAKAYYAELKVLAKDYSKNEEVASRHAVGAYNMTAYISPDQVSEAENYYTDLQNLTKLFPYNKYIALRQADGALNLISKYITQGQMSKAEVHYSILKALTIVYLNNQEITLCQVKGALHLISECLIQEQVFKAEFYYSDLQASAKYFPFNEEIAYKQAVGASLLISHCPKHEHWFLAEAHYADLQSLTKAHPTNEEIVLWQAMGACSLIDAYSNQSYMPNAETLYDDLKNLTKEYPHNEKIALWQAQAAKDMANRYGILHILPRAESLYTDLQSLAEIYPLKEEIVLKQAQGAYNLIVDYISQKELLIAETRYNDLKTLAITHLHHKEITLEQAGGAFALINGYCSQEKWPQAEYYYNELKGLAKIHSQNEKIVLKQSQGAFNLINYYGAREKLNQAESKYTDLQTLTKAYSHNEEIVLDQAMGASNLISYYCFQKQYSRAEASYFDLQALAKTYCHNEEIMLRQIRGAAQQLNSVPKEEKIHRKVYFMKILRTLEGYLEKYNTDENWQERIIMIRNLCTENQWLKS